jgi:pyruvate formate lyase activating enzyme
MTSRISEPVTGLVANIQRFSLHDGPGIRTLVFLKGCSLACGWCSNPESMHGFRMVMYQPHKCIGCWTCVNLTRRGEVEPEGGRVRLNRERIRTSELEWAEVCPTGALAVIGQKRGVDELLDEILKDRLFYEQSGGGVTFSGGEPLLQAAFVDAVAAKCRDRGVHTAVETSCALPQRTLTRATSNVDLFICTLISVDDELHRRYAGGSNVEVLANIRWLASEGPEKLIVRTPLVPDVNMDEHSIRDNLRFLADAGVRYYDVLPFHRLGAAKYAGLGETYSYAATHAPAEDVVEAIRSTIRESGLSTEYPGGSRTSTPGLAAAEGRK